MPPCRGGEVPVASVRSSWRFLVDLTEPVRLRRRKLKCISVEVPVLWCCGVDQTKGEETNKKRKER